MPNALAKRVVMLLAAAAWICQDASHARACPFCEAVKPTIAQMRAGADVAILADCSEAGDPSANKPPVFRIGHILHGSEVLGQQTSVAAPLEAPVKQGDLVLLLAARAGGAEANLATGPFGSFTWQCLVLNEASYGYVARAPSLRLPAEKRLPYFIPFLEHPDPLIAEDAYLEFGHAPYEAVAGVAPRMDVDKLREWITDPSLATARKGFYGLTLGLTAQGAHRPRNLEILKMLIRQGRQPGSDFRAGFDGILGGYLVADGSRAIDEIDRRFLQNPDAAVGDVRHAHRALRFYHDVAPPDERQRVTSAVEHLLDRPAEAPAAITDLARWRAWTSLPRVAALYPAAGADNAAALRRAIVGYVRVCPLPEAASALKRLRQRDPQGVAAAEKSLDFLGSAR